MKFLIIAVAFLACAYADVSELSGGYDYHPPQQTYLPPSSGHEELSEPIHAPAPQYIPPAHEHHEHHHVEAPAPAYIPPAPQHHEELSQPINTYLPPQEHQVDGHDDGYRYKTVRRVVYRHRH